jgi:hypothetical protein
MTSYARVLTSSAERMQMTRDRRRRGVRLAQNVEFTADVAEFLAVNGYLHPGALTNPYSNKHLRPDSHHFGREGLANRRAGPELWPAAI